MVLGLLSHAASVAIGALYPAFKTFKVIREGNYSQMKRWLKYWTVYAGFLAAETIGDALLLQYIVPGYLLMKLGFLVWTACPWTDGASTVHKKLIAPLLTTYEQDIDEMLDDMRYAVQRQVSRLGNGALDKARDGLLSLAATDGLAITHDVFTGRGAPVTVAVEEQAEEDVVCLSDEGARVKMELDEQETSRHVGSNRGDFDDDVDVISTKTKKKPRRNRKARGDQAEEGPSRRTTRRVRADRSTSHGR